MDNPPSAPAWRTPWFWLLAAALVVSALVVRPLAVELGTGLVFGFVTERPVDWILQHIHRARSAGWRWFVATAVVTVAVLLLLVPASFALWVAIEEFGRLVASAHLDTVASSPAALSAWITRHLGAVGRALPVNDLVLRARGLAGSSGAWAARMTGRGLAATPDIIFSTVVVITAWVTFTVRGPALRAAVVPRILPWPREQRIVRNTTAAVIESVVLANVGVSVVQAGLITVSTLALGIPHAVVWGVASFVLSFIPLVGTGLVTLTASAYLFASGRTGATVAMFAVAIVAGSVDNLLRPLLARGSSELPFVWMLVAFVGGVTAFGVSGILLGPLAMALTVALWNPPEDATP